MSTRRVGGSKVIVLSVSEWNCGSCPEVGELFGVTAPDPLDLPFADVPSGDHQDGDHRVRDLVGVASPAAPAIGASQLDVQLISLAVDDHDQVRRASAVEVWVDLCTFPGRQQGDPVFGHISQTGGARGISGNPPRSYLFEPLSQARNGI